MARTPWKNSKNRYHRKEGLRDAKQRFLIVCEGEKTEPNYFSGFRVPGKVEVYISPGAGVHVSVVEKAIALRDEAEDEYDQIWCVFDRDKDPKKPNDRENFNRAISLAERENIKVAYSNDAFELWYLLHFDYHDVAIARKDYLSKLNGKMPGGYKKNDIDTFGKLADLLPTARRNADKLLGQYAKPDPANDDPSTTVHFLVAELQKYL